MKDSEFNNLKLRMSIVPEQTLWPEPKYTHWQKIHDTANSAREAVAKADERMDAVEHDRQLSDEGKRSARAKVAEQAVADLQKSDSLEKARASVTSQMQRWAAKVDEVIKPAEDAHTVTLHAEIRGRVANMTREDRLTFFQKHGGEPMVASALLTAPAFLSNVTEAECAMVRSRVEKSVLSSEILEARSAVTKALADAERGWERALALISERGNLDKVEKSRAA